MSVAKHIRVERYKTLKQAGFTSKQANQYKDRKKETIAQLIQVKLRYQVIIDHILEEIVKGTYVEKYTERKHFKTLEAHMNGKTPKTRIKDNMSKEDWKRIKDNIKIQKELVKNGKTPHIRDLARHRLKNMIEQKKYYESRAWV